MFSGIVETIGNIIRAEIMNGCKNFTVSPHCHFNDLVVGDSISINGVCLTVTNFTDTTFDVTAVPETLRLTNLDNLKVNSLVNLERSLTLAKRISGHYVQGHVDGTGKIIEIINDHSKAWLVKISISNSLAKYIVTKGYITLDGMSITVIDTNPNWFTVTFIPHTQDVTIVNRYQIGDDINIEVDITGKYIEKLLGAYNHVNLS